MKVAIIGFGKMGQAIKTLAEKENHEVSLIIDRNNSQDFTSEKLQGIDVAFEFSEPGEASGNVMKLLQSGVSVVCGTTGWTIETDLINKVCSEKGIAFFHASNFSPGTWMFFRLNEWFAKQMTGTAYEVSIREKHHIHKKDKPSGTAITLANYICQGNPSFTGWKPDNDFSCGNKIPVSSVREGEIAGIHTSVWDSDYDTIEITHTAKNRAIFAQGAMMAATLIQGKTGIFNMSHILSEYFNL
ncbi:MAG: 4-hydroxy-tetrahydrodipicolinate reductase [Bacteroidetes bacterium HGW-Bacteroidetes-21]|nr:MAG: 4-hydroxy-tetrahydrodipicolinate reductase [Bacteroidetes bacterium HGW-Bacteroidetes-21]